MGVKLKNTSSEILSYTDGTLDITLAYLAATVNTLSVTVTGKVNFSIISGNARFYTDSGGTTGETNTWDATSGAVRTIYLKGASGDSVMRVSNVDRWTRWDNWAGTGLSVKALPLSSLPRVMTYIQIAGSNTITGNLADAPAGLTVINILGSNTITGNLSDAPADLRLIQIIGLNTINDYTAGRAWATNYNYLYLRQAAGQGFDSAEVNNILIDLAAATWGGSSRTLDLKGVNAARTSASDAAVATLISKSVSVLTN